MSSTAKGNHFSLFDKLKPNANVLIDRSLPARHGASDGAREKKAKLVAKMGWRDWDACRVIITLLGGVSGGSGANGSGGAGSMLNCTRSLGMGLGEIGQSWNHCQWCCSIISQPASQRCGLRFVNQWI